MPRRKRAFISRDFGSHHLVTRVAGGAMLLGDVEKEHLLKMLERYAAAFFVQVHGFAIMSNHVHLVVTEQSVAAAAATESELLKRYHGLRGRDAEPPVGKQKPDGTVELDEDGGLDRLRRRLGSVSCFVQALKQDFSRWYNKRHGRKGYFWGDRFHDKVLERGDAELACRGYIDLNPLRAGLAKVPEAYRWCSLGLMVRNPKRARALLSALPGDETGFEWYRLFVYRTGSIRVSGKVAISPAVLASVEAACGRLGLGDMLRHRARNMTEGLALGSRPFIEKYQAIWHHSTVAAHPLTPTGSLFVTRNMVRA